MTLSEFKAARGLKLIELAALLGLPVSTTQGYLSGTRKAEPERLSAICTATDGLVTPADLRPDLARLFVEPVSERVAA